MSKKRKLMRQNNKFVVASIQVPEYIKIRQQLIKDADMMFEKNPNITGFIRDYVPGEFPKNRYPEEAERTFKYIQVVKGPNGYLNYPLTEEDYQEIKAIEEKWRQENGYQTEDFREL